MCVLLALSAAAVVGMRIVWTRRLVRSTAVLPTLPKVPAYKGGLRLGSIDATYLSTTRAGRPLDRISVHGLGVRSPAVVDVHNSGVLVRRRGTGDLYIAADALLEVSRGAVMAGIAVGSGRMVIIRWCAGGATLETGLLLHRLNDRTDMVAAMHALTTPTVEHRRKDHP